MQDEHKLEPCSAKNEAEILLVPKNTALAEADGRTRTGLRLGAPPRRSGRWAGCAAA